MAIGKITNQSPARANVEDHNLIDPRILQPSQKHKR